MAYNVRAYATSRLTDRSRADGMLYTRCYAMSRAEARRRAEQRDIRAHIMQNTRAEASDFA